MIVLIRIQDVFTPLPLRVILMVSNFYMDMNCLGLVRVVSSWLRVGSVAADSFGWVVADGFRWFRVVSDGFRWFVLLVVTFPRSINTMHTYLSLSMYTFTIVRL